MHTRAFRDRHGHGIRGPLLPTGLPRYRTRSQNFDRIVLDAYATIHARLADQLDHLDLAVDTIPRMRLRADALSVPDDVVTDGPVPLGRLLPAGLDPRGRPTRARIVIFRSPIEQRTTSPDRAEQLAARRALIARVLTVLVAQYLNVPPDMVDPAYEDED